MKLLVLTKLFPNNINPIFGVFVKERIKALAQNCEVKVVAPVPWAPPLKQFKKWYYFSQVCDQEIIDGLEVFHPRYINPPKIGRSLYGFFYYLGIISLINKIYKEFKFDFIDVHWAYPDGFGAILVSRYFNKPCVITVRGSDINSFTNKPFLRSLILYTLQNATTVLAVSHDLKKKMIKLGCAEQNIQVIPNGVDPSLFYPISKTKARSNLDLGSDLKILLAVGNLIPLKRFHLLIDCMYHIVKKNENKNIKLIIIGEGNQRKNLKEQVAQLSLQPNIKFVGRVNHHEMYLWYNAADLLTVVSESEGCPNIILEALACGTPVLAYSTGGIPEIINQKVGMLVNDVAPHYFARMVEKALNKNWQKNSIISHAKLYTWDTISKKIIEQYKPLLKKNH